VFEITFIHYSLEEYAQRKGNQVIPKTLLCIYLFYYFNLIQILGLYKSYPLKINLVLEISEKEDIGRVVCNLAFSF
jgi:hypothetical protein